MSTLYLVATPIGNLEDITLRALRILKDVKLIAAEDTRQTKKLLKHYSVETKTTSYHDHNKETKTETILTALSQGDVALVSDAGTPLINDPGYELVQAAVKAGHTVTPIPGPSAPITALSASGLPTDTFLFAGYLPRKKSARRQFLEEIVILPYTLIFLETPHRLFKALQDMLEILGDRPIAIARELTKLHEEIFRGSIETALEYFTRQTPRGEFTVIVGRGLEQALEDGKQWSITNVINAIDLGLKRGDTPTQLAKKLASESGWERREIYRLIASLSQTNEAG